MANVLDIPTTVGPTSYSGLGSAFQKFSGGNILNLLKDYVGNYANNVNTAYGNASSGLGTLTQTQLMPALQSTMNNLASRNMINSSVASDTMSKTSSNIMSSLLGNQANIANSQANALTSGYGNTLMNAANLGQYSTSSNTAVPYQIMAQLLSAMM